MGGGLSGKMIAGGTAPPPATPAFVPLFAADWCFFALGSTSLDTVPFRFAADWQALLSRPEALERVRHTKTAVSGGSSYVDDGVSS